MIFPTVFFTVAAGLCISGASALADNGHSDNSSVVNATSGPAQMMVALNLQRRQQKLAPLCVSGGLSKIADQYARKQAEMNDPSHYADGRSPEDRLSSYPTSSENLILVPDRGDPETALKLLKNTDGDQYGNLMSSKYNHVGIGRSSSTGVSGSGSTSYYWVILLAKTADVCQGQQTLNQLIPKAVDQSRQGRGWLASILSPLSQSEQTDYSSDMKADGSGGSESLTTTTQTNIDSIPKIDQSGWNSKSSALDEYVQNPFAFAEKSLAQQYGSTWYLNDISDSENSSDDD